MDFVTQKSKFHQKFVCPLDFLGQNSYYLNRGIYICRFIYEGGVDESTKKEVIIWLRIKACFMTLEKSLRCLA